VAQIERKKGIMREKAVFKQERFESVRIIRVWNVFEDRRVKGSRRWEGKAREDGVREIGVDKMRGGRD